MGKYSTKGGYGAYDKNNKERDALDYYATPPEEVLNILEQYHPNFDNVVILEHCCGGGHMVEGIVMYCEKYYYTPKRIIATDIKDRGAKKYIDRDYIEYYFGDEYDYLSDTYPFFSVDYIIMNPPFSVITPFVLRSLEITQNIIMLGRTKFIETIGRYKKIFEPHPFDYMYQYIDRVACYKNGDFTLNPDSIEAYAWFVWEKEKITFYPFIKWIRRK